jgi:hypothetical protein
LDLEVEKQRFQHDLDNSYNHQQMEKLVVQHLLRIDTVPRIFGTASLELDCEPCCLVQNFFGLKIQSGIQNQLFAIT